MAQLGNRENGSNLGTAEMAQLGNRENGSNLATEKMALTWEPPKWLNSGTEKMALTWEVLELETWFWCQMMRNNDVADLSRQTLVLTY